MRNPIIRLGPALAALVTVLGGCQSEVIDLSVPTGLPGGFSYSADVQPIFRSSCGGGACHIDRTTSGVNLTSHEQAVNSVGLQYGRVIVRPGDADASPLIDKIGQRPQFGVRMPRGRQALSQEQISTIRAWIENGALND